jgi:hypothetical protein
VNGTAGVAPSGLNGSGNGGVIGGNSPGAGNAGLTGKIIFTYT